MIRLVYVLCMFQDTLIFFSGFACTSKAKPSRVILQSIGRKVVPFKFAVNEDCCICLGIYTRG